MQLNFVAPALIFKVQGALDCLSKLQFSYKVYNLCVGLLFDILDKTAEMRWIKVVDVSSRQLALSATDKPTTESLDHTPWPRGDTIHRFCVAAYNTWMLLFIWQTWSYAWFYSTYGTTREWALPFINENHGVIQKIVLVYRYNDIFLIWYWISVQKVKTNFVTLKVSKDVRLQLESLANIKTSFRKQLNALKTSWS